jgi:hypothetical protein
VQKRGPEGQKRQIRIRKNTKKVTGQCFETALPEIHPGLPLPKGGEVICGNSMNLEAFSPFEKGGLRGI